MKGRVLFGVKCHEHNFNSWSEKSYFVCLLSPWFVISCIFCFSESFKEIVCTRWWVFVPHTRGHHVGKTFSSRTCQFWMLADQSDSVCVDFRPSSYQETGVAARTWHPESVTNGQWFSLWIRFHVSCCNLVEILFDLLNNDMHSYKYLTLKSYMLFCYFVSCFLGAWVNWFITFYIQWTVCKTY